MRCFRSRAFEAALGLLRPKGGLCGRAHGPRAPPGRWRPAPRRRTCCATLYRTRQLLSPANPCSTGSTAAATCSRGSTRASGPQASTAMSRTLSWSSCGPRGAGTALSDPVGAAMGAGPLHPGAHARPAPRAAGTLRVGSIRTLRAALPLHRTAQHRTASHRRTWVRSRNTGTNSPLTCSGASTSLRGPRFCNRKGGGAKAMLGVETAAHHRWQHATESRCAGRVRGHSQLPSDGSPPSVPALAACPRLSRRAPNHWRVILAQLRQRGVGQPHGSAMHCANKAHPYPDGPAGRRPEARCARPRRRAGRRGRTAARMTRAPSTPCPPAAARQVGLWAALSAREA